MSQRPNHQVWKGILRRQLTTSQDRTQVISVPRSERTVCRCQVVQRKADSKFTRQRNNLGTCFEGMHLRLWQRITALMGQASIEINLSTLLGITNIIAPSIEQPSCKTLAWILINSAIELGHIGW